MICGSLTGSCAKHDCIWEFTALVNQGVTGRPLQTRRAGSPALGHFQLCLAKSLEPLRAEIPHLLVNCPKTAPSNVGGNFPNA